MLNTPHIRIIATPALFIVLCCLLGCSTKTCISFEDINSRSTDNATESIIDSKKKINKAILKSGAVVIFNKDGGQLDPEKQIITGIASDGTKNGTQVELIYSDIFALQLKEHSATKTRLLLIGAGLVVTPILLTILLSIF